VYEKTKGDAMSDTVKHVLEKIKNENLDMVDIKFVDLHGSKKAYTEIG